MGTNLSQVFISNTDVLESGTSFTGIASTPEIGIWNLAGNSGAGAYVNTALYQATADLTDLDTGESLAAIANPLWLYNNLQFVQGTSGNPIATPMINTRNIRRIKYDPYQAFVGTKATIADATLNVAGALDNDEYNFKFIVKSTPTDYLSFYDQEGLNLFVDFPLGAFNTTNHKAINMSVVIPDVSDADAAGNVTAVQNAIAAHPLLSKMVTAADVGTDIVITAIHPGLVFELIIQNLSQDTTPVDCTITGQVLGVGNDWQVAGEEIRTRGRYGNFNRMYLPQNMPLYTTKGYFYDKVTIEYEHNWPTSTGIAPAGTLNQVVLYFTDSDGTAPVVGDTGTATYDDAFGITIATAAEFIW